jgi:DNA-binding transcriptional LysR family regulator
VPNLGGRTTGFEYLDAQGQARQQVVPGALTVNTTAAYEAAALAGLGIIQVPEAGMRQHLAAGRLRAVLPDWPAPPMPVSLLYPNRRHLPRRVQVFMQWLAALVTPRLRGPAG